MCRFSRTLETRISDSRVASEFWDVTLLHCLTEGNHVSLVDGPARLSRNVAKECITSRPEERSSERDNTICCRISYNGL